MSRHDHKDIAKFVDFLYTIENDLCDSLNKINNRKDYDQQYVNNRVKIPVNNTQEHNNYCATHTKSTLSGCKLFTFLPTQTSARPFVSYQNRWEQIDDVNKQYIDAIMHMHNANTSQQEDKTDDFETLLHKIRTGNDNETSSPQQHTQHDNSRREWVNSPQHYNPGLYETWRIINEYGLDKDFYLATALRYILRAGKKYNNKFAEDLRKAIWYLNKRATMWEQDNEL
jgi:hypothetical protein